ncbi:MAG TPA: PilZ domain-containing protein [Gaiellales bacterium]|nr:PilZ domain-containing protein [Gaiellales bacterium]
MTERRRWPRQLVGWAVMMSLDDGRTVIAHAVDASLHGLRIQVADGGDGAIREGARCTIEVQLAGGQARFVRGGEVRHVGQHGVGVHIAKPMPIVMEPAPSEPPTAIVAEHVSAASGASLASLLRLRGSRGAAALIP